MDAAKLVTELKDVVERTVLAHVAADKPGPEEDIKSAALDAVHKAQEGLAALAELLEPAKVVASDTSSPEVAEPAAPKSAAPEVAGQPATS